MPTLLDQMLERHRQAMDRLRTSHDALLRALSWCVEHADECLADHPDIFAAACAAAAAAKDV